MSGKAGRKGGKGQHGDYRLNLDPQDPNYIDSADVTQNVLHAATEDKPKTTVAESAESLAHEPQETSRVETAAAGAEEPQETAEEPQETNKESTPHASEQLSSSNDTAKTSSLGSSWVRLAHEPQVTAESTPEQLSSSHDTAKTSSLGSSWAVPDDAPVGHFAP